MADGNLYLPDASALLNQQTWGNAFLGQRDVGLLVPINYLSGPMISLRAACFADNQYDNKRFIKCLSNLLASGFRRFVVDVYWDPGRSVWSLCPVEVPESDASAEIPPGVVTVSSARKDTQPETTKSGQAARFIRDILPTFLPLRDVQNWARQDGSSSSLSRSVSSSVSSRTASEEVAPSATDGTTASSSSVLPSTSATTSLPNLPGYDNQSQYQIGSYTCSSTINLDFLTGLLEDYLGETDVTTSATISVLTLNLHAAAPLSSPDDPPEQVAANAMPSSGNLIRDVIRGNLTNKLYTPYELQEDRINLNRSWFDVAWDNRALPGYLQSTPGPNNIQITNNGWPTIAFMVFKEFERVLAQFGTIDPQMQEYNLTADKDTIFGTDELFVYHNTTISSTGRVSNGCLFSPSEVSVTSNTNSSWAFSRPPSLDIPTSPSLNTTIPAITNLTRCGYSSYLNETLNGQTADQNPVPYLSFMQSTLWSWAPGEPVDATNDNQDNYSNKCTAMAARGQYPGRWYTVNCRDRKRVACHSHGEPYNWTVSTDTVDYFSGDNACPKGYIFSVPHTPLENAHLHSALQNTPDPDVYLNFNSVDEPNCWTININGTCPYLARQDLNKTRVVVVPTIAAVIIFVLAALTFFVKCAANRRDGKRGKRRRMIGGWEYEGVPS